MSDIVWIDSGNNTPISTDYVQRNGNYEHVQYVKLMDGADGSTEVISGSAASGLKVYVSNEIPVTGNFYPSVQSIAGYIGISSFSSLLLGVTGTFFQEVQPVSVSGGSITVTGGTVNVAGTFWQDIQNVSGGNLYTVVTGWGSLLTPLNISGGNINATITGFGPLLFGTPLNVSGSKLYINMQDYSGNAINSTNNALDVNIKAGSISGVTHYGGETANANTTGVMIMGTDGTYARALKSDSTGNLVVTGAMNIVGSVPVTGSVTVDGTVQEVPLSAFGTFQATIGTGGTRIQFGSNPCKSVTIKAKVDNSGVIYVGGSGVTSSNGFILSAGDTLSMDINNTNLIYLDCSVSNDGVSVIYAN